MQFKQFYPLLIAGLAQPECMGWAGVLNNHFSGCEVISAANTVHMARKAYV